MERVSWPVAPTTSLAAVTSAHVAPLSVAVRVIGAKIQGTLRRLLTRCFHIRICSVAVRPPVMAGSFMIRDRSEGIYPVQHMGGLADLHYPVPPGQSRLFFFRGGMGV